MLKAICPKCKKEIIGSSYNGKCKNCFLEENRTPKKENEIIIKRQKY